MPNGGHERWTFEVTEGPGAALPGDITVDETVVLDLRMEQSFAIAQGSTTRVVWQRMWIAPCLGEIARMISSDEDFGTLTSVRRLLP